MFIPMPVEASPDNANYCQGFDENGIQWEFNYVIPMSDPEYLEYRQVGMQTFHKLPGWALPPIEVMEFFHGPLNQEPSDDSKTLDYLAAVLCENEWNGDTADRIADIVRSTGRAVEDSPS